MSATSTVGGPCTSPLFLPLIVNGGPNYLAPAGTQNLLSRATAIGSVTPGGPTPIATELSPDGARRGALASGPTILALNPSVGSDQPVGCAVTWTAMVADNLPLEYRFSVAPMGGSSQIARDYEPSNSFTWTTLAEGSYTVQVSVQEVPPSANTPTTLTSAPFSVLSRATGNQPLVSPTVHPLIALYSIPPCGTGTVLVLFGTDPQLQGAQSTPSAPCSTTLSSNFYLVGMRQSSTYYAEAEFTNGGTTFGPINSFVTGLIPPTVTLPTMTEPVLPSGATSVQDSVVFHDAIGARMQRTWRVT